MGDLATNDGHSGCQGRHFSVLTELVRVLRMAYGRRVEYEPKGYRDYSDTRPDLTIQSSPKTLAQDPRPRPSPKTLAQDPRPRPSPKTPTSACVRVCEQVFGDGQLGLDGRRAVQRGDAQHAHAHAPLPLPLVRRTPRKKSGRAVRPEVRAVAAAAATLAVANARALAALA